MTTNSNDIDGAILHELIRIIGERNSHRLGEFSMILPLIDEDDALTFLRTVPAGATADEIKSMAAAYRMRKPIA